MTRGYSRSRRLISQLNRPSTDNTICNSCLLALHRRYATASAVAASIPDSIPIAQHTPPVTTATAPHQSYQIQAGIVVSRPPLLTRDLHPFEKAYYFYQRRLNERLALPFTRYFYYQKDTPADTDWKKKIKARLTPARDIGIYNAYGKEGWADELLVGAKESEPSEQVEALLKDAQVETDEDSGSAKKDKVEKPMPRTTEADRDGDTRSLNRALSRTLYLVVQGANGGWGFPCGELAKKETLHTAAERLLVQSAGINMNTWIVGNHPVGHYNLKYAQPRLEQETKIEQLGAKTFFMKARIMAGQANLKDNKLGLQDFKWLAKDELEKEVQPQYWKHIKNMLVDR
ncbi:54S ribosomal protein L17 mitochondrial [Ptychographa xylographoides]|nr:54S ribosomal protein L17 mitochondrial [Ptychographa xylographoides]